MERSGRVNAGADTRASFKVLKACSCPQSHPRGVTPATTEFKGLTISANPGIRRRQRPTAPRHSLTRFLAAGVGICSVAGTTSFPVSQLTSQVRDLGEHICLSFQKSYSLTRIEFPKGLWWLSNSPPHPKINHLHTEARLPQGIYFGRDLDPC